jgi:hypothetical protein
LAPTSISESSVAVRTTIHETFENSGIATETTLTQYSLPASDDAESSNFIVELASENTILPATATPTYDTITQLTSSAKSEVHSSTTRAENRTRTDLGAMVLSYVNRNSGVVALVVISFVTLIVSVVFHIAVRIMIRELKVRENQRFD